LVAALRVAGTLSRWRHLFDLPDEPETVLRRRNSPEAQEDEVFTRDRGWQWTGALVSAESGRSSDVEPMTPIDRAEAEAILRRTHQVTGATDL
jgi:hypothetical protein